MLKPSHEAFARGLARGLPAHAAYIEAGFAKHNARPRSRALAQKTEIRQRVRLLKRAATLSPSPLWETEAERTSTSPECPHAEQSESKRQSNRAGGISPSPLWETGAKRRSTSAGCPQGEQSKSKGRSNCVGSISPSPRLRGTGAKRRSTSAGCPQGEQSESKGRGEGLPSSTAPPTPPPSRDHLLTWLWHITTGHQIIQPCQLRAATLYCRIQGWHLHPRSQPLTNQNTNPNPNPTPHPNPAQSNCAATQSNSWADGPTMADVITEITDLAIPPPPGEPHPNPTATPLTETERQDLAKLILQTPIFPASPASHHPADLPSPFLCPWPPSSVLPSTPRPDISPYARSHWLTIRAQLIGVLSSPLGRKALNLEPLPEQTSPPATTTTTSSSAAATAAPSAASASSATSRPPTPQNPPSSPPPLIPEPQSVGPQNSTATAKKSSPPVPQASCPRPPTAPPAAPESSCPSPASSPPAAPQPTPPPPPRRPRSIPKIPPAPPCPPPQRYQTGPLPPNAPFKRWTSRR